MATLTSKELSSIEDQLTAEKTIITKFNHYADETNDLQLKSMLQDVANRHQSHFDRLYSLLG